MPEQKIDPKLDLVLVQTVEATPEQMWRAWTEPKLLMQWFCPLPWKVVECEIDPRPGGKFTSLFQSPEGEKFPNTGCFLELVPNKKLIWTDTMTEGFRPAKKKAAATTSFSFTGILTFEAVGNKTKYTAIGRHGSVEDVETHKGMGFHEGWTKATEQMIAMIKKW